MCNRVSFASLALFDISAAALLCVLAPTSVLAQTTNNNTSQPMYEVTIVSRTTKALNYGYL